MGAAPYLVDVLHLDAMVLQPPAALHLVPAHGQYRGGRQGVAGRKEGSVSPRGPPPVPHGPPDPHPRSSISACASTGTVTATDALVELGLFLLWGHGWGERRPLSLGTR